MINEEELRKLVNRLGQEKLEKKNVFAKKVYMQTNYADRPARGQGYANAGERYAGGDADGGIGGANGAGAGYSVGSGRPRKKRETALMKSEKQLITWLQSKPGIPLKQLKKDRASLMSRIWRAERRLLKMEKEMSS